MANFKRLKMKLERKGKTIKPSIIKWRAVNSNVQKEKENMPV